MTKDSSGKTKVEKAGLKEITREGFEYELTCNLELDINHNATASKDRTGLFADKPMFTPSIETGQLIRQWCEQGVDPMDEIHAAIDRLNACKTVEELKSVKANEQAHIVVHPEYKRVGNELYNALNLPV